MATLEFIFDQGDRVRMINDVEGDVLGFNSDQDDIRTVSVRYLDHDNEIKWLWVREEDLDLVEGEEEE